MTYCVAAVTDRGIVFASDSRTNAGVDQLATFSKMTVFEAPDDRVVVLLSAGNLASTQSVISLLKLRMRNEAGGVDPQGIIGLRSLYDVATLVGDTMREVVARDGPALTQENIDPGCTFIMGGQIKGKSQRLFRIYAQGNFIESSRDTNYFQIGETKYGKPIIDRVISRFTPLADAVKCVLVSFDSTMRSNLSVGMPIDLICYDRDSFAVKKRRRFDHGDAYFAALSREWGEGTRQVFSRLPELGW
jgi:putative proteasome-type protease